LAWFRKEVYITFWWDLDSLVDSGLFFRDYIPSAGNSSCNVLSPSHLSGGSAVLGGGLRSLIASVSVHFFRCIHIAVVKCQ